MPEAPLTAQSPIGEWLAIKAKLYGEAHSIGDGALQVRNNVAQTLPGDSGWLVGGQLSLFRQNTRDYLHLFLRYGQDLAAFGALQVPRSPMICSSSSMSGFAVPGPHVAAEHFADGNSAPFDCGMPAERM